MSLFVLFLLFFSSSIVVSLALRLINHTESNSHNNIHLFSSETQFEKEEQSQYKKEGASFPDLLGLLRFELNLVADFGDGEKVAGFDLI
ncbi:hypothetical protein L1987_49921 [Smallanthus sonchifolius]|uniref:Uncharacterized protein n=1 Tax=Smallanthus sonchifolius TaxID=185202 RepID=A0ACB9FVT9_9ASTR|nr:hypothetical protein L1987_49921 [Smallanthus sonchifolius]